MTDGIACFPQSPKNHTLSPHLYPPITCTQYPKIQYPIPKNTLYPKNQLFTSRTVFRPNTPRNSRKYTPGCSKSPFVISTSP